jgi:bifunctional ADP-heptose synthase (sugar kinase/adenylyltransferase)
VDSFDFIKVNKSEYMNNKVIADNNKEKFLITKGKEGVTHNDRIFNSPNPQDTIDVSGAGDTFMASFTLKYLITNNLEESIMYANNVCANVVNKKGVSLPDKKFKLK